MPAKSDPRDTFVTTRPFNRIAAVVLVALAMVAWPRANAAAQTVLCEGNATEVHALHFEGNTTFSDDELSSRVITTPSSLTRRVLAALHIPWGGARRCYPDVGLKPDVDSLKLFYRYNGFPDTRVDTIVKPSGPAAVDITFRIQEGQPVILDTLRITGLDSVANRDELLRKLPLRVGERVGVYQLTAAYDSLVTSLRNSGYPHAEVLRSFDTHTAAHRAEAELAVKTGAFARFGTIAIHREGVTDETGRTRPPAIDSEVVLDLLRFRAGQPYSDTALIASSQFLYSLETYRHVGIAPDTAYQHGDSIADIAVDLREDFMHEIDQREGWGTLDCFRASTVYTDKNFQGKARRLALTARASKLGYGDLRRAHSDWLRRHACWYPMMRGDSIGSSKVNDYFGATVTYPNTRILKWTPSISVYTERRGQYKSYLRTTDFGFNPSFVRELVPFVPIRVGYTFEHGQVSAENAVLCGVFNRCSQDERDEVQARKPLGVVSVALQTNRTDNVIAPTAGYAWATEFRTSNQVTASDPTLAFNKITGDASIFRSLSSKIVFAGRLRAGYIAGGTTRGGTRLPPPQERLFAGGYGSVRGFNQNELGPQVYLLNLDAITVDTIAKAADGTSVTETWVAQPGKRPDRFVPSGGNALFVGNAELRFRGGFLPAGLELAPFVDAGQVWITQVGKHINVPQIAVTPGLTFRYFVSIAPIQVNLGYNSYPPPLGTAYFAQPVSGPNNLAPLICVTAPGETPVPVVRYSNGTLEQKLAACPATYRPPPAQSFLQRLGSFTRRIIFSINVGTEF